MKCVLFTNERDILEALTGRRIDGFIHDQSTLNYYAARIHRPALVVYTTRLRRLQYAFGLPTGSPLRKDLNITLLALMNDPYWDFLTDYYGLYEKRSDQTSSSFHHAGRPGS
jgi:ABC-type amino acid transport substrate-binding protein